MFQFVKNFKLPFGPLFSKVMVYSFGSTLMTLAGLVSFPIFTRLLNADDYGLMSLINVTISLAVIFCKGGLQGALIRYWGGDLGHTSQNVVVSTALLGAMGISGIVIFVLGGVLFPVLGLNKISLSMFIVVALILFFETVKSILLNRKTANQQVFKYNLISIVHRYLTIVSAALIMLFFGSTVFNFFFGTLLSASIIVVWLLFEKEDSMISFKYFEYKVFQKMIVFGLPLVMYELTSQVLTFSDRYLIAFFIGSEAVGQYSAAYNLTFYIQYLMVSSISLAIYPALVEEINKGALSVSRKIIDESLLWFSLIGGAITFGFICVGPDFLILFASDRYIEGASVVLPVMLGGFMYGIFTIAIGELFIAKKTILMAQIMGISALLNLILNFVAIPSAGILGAGYSTLVAEVFLAVGGLFYLGKASLVGNITGMMHYLTPPLIMYAVLNLFASEPSWSSVFERIVAGFFIWAVSTVIFIPEGRRKIASWRRS